MNITYSEATHERHILLFRFASEHGRLPQDFPLVHLESFGCVLLHRWMLRTYYEVEVTYSILTEDEVAESHNRELDAFARLETPRFEELMVLSLSIYLADSEGPTRALNRLRQHVAARANFNRCNICFALKPKTSFR